MELTINPYLRAYKHELEMETHIPLETIQAIENLKCKLDNSQTSEAELLRENRQLWKELKELRTRDLNKALRNAP